MFIPFQEMPQTARVWIYQSNRTLSEEEQSEILPRLGKFVAQWTAHQQELRASYHFFYNRFLVIALDEDYTAASGCSIDASVHFLQGLEQQFNLSFFDRDVAFLTQDDNLQTADFKNLKQYVAEGLIKENTIIFNNLVKNIKELNAAWQQPAKTSWMARYF